MLNYVMWVASVPMIIFMTVSRCANDSSRSSCCSHSASIVVCARYTLHHVSLTPYAIRSQFYENDCMPAAYSLCGYMESAL